jgi:PAS domain S-box-containing protein
MRDSDRSKEELIKELEFLRQRVAGMAESPADDKTPVKTMDEAYYRGAMEEGRAMLAEANLMFQTVMDTIPVRIFWKDLHSVYLGCNRLFAKDAGREEPGDIIGEDDYHMPWIQQADSFRKIDHEVITSNIAKKDYNEYRTMPNGEHLWLQTTKAPLCDLEGRVIGVLGAYDDITEKKRVADLLKESEERYRSIFQNNYATQLIIDPENGGIVDANPAACRYYGYDLDTLRTMNITGINTLTPGQLFEEMARAKAEGRNQLYFFHRLANGDIRPVEVYSGPVVVNGRELLYSIVHDISKRKKAEEERERLIRELKDALSKIKKLSGLLPICASCKKIRDDKGYWNQIESYIRDHSEAEFSHGICPDCLKRLYPEFVKPDDLS